MLGGWAGPGLLKSYDAERRPVAEATSARASSRSVEHSHPGYIPAPGAAGPGGKKGGILNVALAYRYPRGAVLGADQNAPIVPDGLRLTGEPGSRAPHMWLDRAGTRVSTLDLYERSMVLLTSSDKWHSAAKDVAQRLSVPLDAYRIGSGTDAELSPRATRTGRRCTASPRTERCWSAPTDSSPGAPRARRRAPRRHCGRPSRRSWTGADGSVHTVISTSASAQRAGTRSG